MTEWAEVRFGEYRYELDFTEDRYCHYDATVSVYTTDHRNVTTVEDYIVEVKHRYKEWAEVMLEKDKYDQLVHLGDGMDARILYVCFLPSGAYEWELEGQDEPAWTTISCNNHTVEGDGKKDKQITFLSTKEAHFINI